MDSPSRKEREFARRETEIFDTALALFSQPDWESVTIDQIARQAEVGKGTVYKHVTSRDELLFRLMVRFYNGLLTELSSYPFDAHASRLDQFAQLLERAFRYHVDHREYRYVIEYCERIDFKERADSGWHEAFRELDNAFAALGDPLLQRGIDNGLIEPRPIVELNIGLRACFTGAVKMLWSGRDWCSHGDAEDVIRATTRFMLAALIGRSGAINPIA